MKSGGFLNHVSCCAPANPTQLTPVDGLARAFHTMNLSVSLISSRSLADWIMTRSYLPSYVHCLLTSINPGSCLGWRYCRPHNGTRDTLDTGRVPTPMPMPPACRHRHHTSRLPSAYAIPQFPLPVVPSKARSLLHGCLNRDIGNPESVLPYLREQLPLY